MENTRFNSIPIDVRFHDIGDNFTFGNQQALCLSQLNESTYRSNQLFPLYQTTVRLPYPNDHLNLGQRATEFRTSQLLARLPYSVCFHFPNDYIPQRAQPSLDQSSLNAFGFRRNQVFSTPLSIRDHFSIPNDHIPLQNQPIFDLAYALRRNQVLDSFRFNERFHDPSSHIPHSVFFLNATEGFSSNHHVEFRSNQVMSPIDQASLRFSDPIVQIPSQNQSALSMRGFSETEFRGSTQVNAPIPITVGGDLGSNDHSFVRKRSARRQISRSNATKGEKQKKYGPYICRRCPKISITSQHFAAHMKGHYRADERAEMKKILQSRSNHIHMRLVQAPNGPMISPCSDDHTLGPSPPIASLRNYKFAGRKRRAENMSSSHVPDARRSRPHQSVHVIKQEPQNAAMVVGGPSRIIEDMSPAQVPVGSNSRPAQDVVSMYEPRNEDMVQKQDRGKATVKQEPRVEDMVVKKGVPLTDKIIKNERI